MIFPFQATFVAIHPIHRKAQTMCSMSGKIGDLSLVRRDPCFQNRGLNVKI